MELPYSEYPPGTSQRDIDEHFESRDTCSYCGTQLDDDGGCQYCNEMDHWADRRHDE